MSKCLDCGAALAQTEGKREKKFCNSSCRSNYWAKQNRKENSLKKIATEAINQYPETLGKLIDKSLPEVVTGNLKVKKEGDRRQVVFEENSKGNIKMFVPPASLPEFIVGVDPANENTETVVMKLDDSHRVVSYEGRTKMSYNDFLKAAKESWDANYEQLPEFLKLNANQRAMIKSKIK